MGERKFGHESTLGELDVVMRSFGLRLIVTHADNHGRADIVASFTDGETTETAFAEFLCDAIDMAFRRWVAARSELLVSKHGRVS